MADGLKLNLKEALHLKNAQGNLWELKGKDSSGTSFSWSSPIAFVVDVSINQTVSFTLPLGDGLIDWGDGNTTVVTASALYSHTYAASTGTYKVVIYGDVLYDWYAYNTNTPSVVGVLSYGHKGDRIPYFYSPNLTYVPSEISPKLTILSRAFRNCSSFNSSSVTSWDTSNVTSMRDMFNNAEAFNQNISSWDVANVTDMQGMFRDTIAFNQDISSWDVFNVANMSFMFYNADGFNQSLSAWDTSSVTTMDYMFYSAGSFNQDITAWDTSNVTSMRYMFQATSLNKDMGALKINSCVDMTSIFEFAPMSTENYSRTLIGFANSHYAGNAQNNVPLGAGTITYNNTVYTTGNQFNDAVSARNYLVNTAGWTITDGGQV